MAYISLQHVGKRYQMGEITITAVDDISFEIEKGRLSFRLTAPYSEERRRAASKQAKQNGVHKKVADLP